MSENTNVKESEVTLGYCNKLMEKYLNYKKTAEQHQFPRLLMYDAKLIPAHRDLNKNWNPEHGIKFVRAMKNIVFPRLGITDDVTCARQNSYITKLVEHIPEHLEEGVLYVASQYDCAMHLCMCGCGEPVCTPLGEYGWSWSKDSDGNVSLHPSIGNFQYPCKSHYFLKDGRVQWC